MKSSVNLLLNVTALQLSQVKCTLEDSINEFIIEELNLLVFAAKPTSNSNPLHSCKHNERWILYENFSELGQIEISLNGQNCLETFTSNSRKLKLVEIS